uniref:Uncharacterized protein n=1 Tax=Opuntia streptacantha TaxID=393608 RepID=A0A7C9AQL2_OPUST
MTTYIWISPEHAQRRSTLGAVRGFVSYSEGSHNQGSKEIHHLYSMNQCSQWISQLSHVWGKDHGNISCIHLVVKFIFHNICHQIDCPIKKSIVCWRKQVHKLGALIFCIAMHDLLWCK